VRPSEAKISATLPKEDGPNGLHSIAGQLAREPEGLHYAVVLLDTGKIERKFEIDEFGDRYEVEIPHARIRAIEPLDGPDAASAAHLMATGRARRTGGRVLPLFGDVAPTGER